MTTAPKCTANLNLSYGVFPCVLKAGHPGRHADDVDTWDIEGFPLVCGAMRSPNPGERYDCSRMKGHQGHHLDDAQNTSWVSVWDPSPDSLTQHLPEPGEFRIPVTPLTEERVNDALMVLERRLREELSGQLKRITDLERKMTHMERSDVHQVGERQIDATMMDGRDAIRD